MHNVLHQAFHCHLVGVYEVAALNLRLDNSGNTAAHVAALRGREDTFKVGHYGSTAMCISVEPLYCVYQ